MTGVNNIVNLMKNKLIPFKDTFLTFKNYKEPLDEIPKDRGYGYYGVLLGTIDGEYVQCHACGELFKELPHHFKKKHNMDVEEYKKEYCLSPNTALVSEDERNRRKDRFLLWLQTLTEEEKRDYRIFQRNKLKKASKKRGKFQPKLTLETMNKRGSCPTQLLQKIKDVSEKIGRTPSKNEFIDNTGGQRYVHLIYKIYGSWEKAVKLAGLMPKERIKNGYKKYSDDELLEYLKLFAIENNKIPTYTDFARGLLPTYETYIRRFGSIEKARQLAEVYEEIN